MRRILKWLAWTLAGLIATLAVLVALIMFGSATEPGQALVATILERSSGGLLTSSGPVRLWPNQLRFAALQLHDGAGVYLRLHNVTIDWSILQLIHDNVDIDRLTVGRATLERIPRSMSGSGSSTSASSRSLPVSVALNTLAVDQLTLSPAVAGKVYQLKLAGSGRVSANLTGQGRLAVTEIGGPATYRVSAGVDARALHLMIVVHEPAHGLIASLADLPAIGAINIAARLDGPQDAIATQLTVAAGQLKASAKGTLNLTRETADLTVDAQAPSMQPRPGLSWQSIALKANLHGRFARPTVTGHLTIDRLAAFGVGTDRLAADISGDQGLVHVIAKLDRLVIPGGHPDLLAGAPLKVDATVHLAEANRPVDFLIQHPLIDAQGMAQTEGTLRARVHLVIPHLQPFAKVAGASLHGHTSLDVSGSLHAGTTHLAVSGTIGLEPDATPAVSLVGPVAHIDTVVDMRGQELTIRRFALTGPNATAKVHGRVVGGEVNLDWLLALSDLSALRPSLQGQIHAQGHVGGTTQDLTVAADLSGQVSAQGMRSGQFTAHLHAQGLPSAPTAQLSAQGSLLGAPMMLAVAARRRADGAYQVAIDRAGWKSAHAQGALTVNPRSLVPQGRVSLTVAHLADLDPLLQMHIAGSIAAELDATEEEAHLTAKVEHAALPGVASVRHMSLRLVVAHPTSQPIFNGELALDNFSAGSIDGSATLRAHGPEDALSVQAVGNLPQFHGASAHVEMRAVANILQRALTVNVLRADWKQLKLRLERPARVAQVSGGVSLQQVRMAIDRGLLAVDGRVGRTLDLTADLLDLPAGIARAVAPDMAASGTISAAARLRGTVARPDGTVRIEARGVHLRRGPGQAMPPANLTASATLHDGESGIAARLDVGKSYLMLTGTAPLSSDRSLGLHTTGMIDLGLVDPLLAANGRRVTGRLHLDVRITGPVNKPLVAGTATIADGDVQDYTYGLHLRDIAATIQADGARLRLTRFTARAGSGTLSGTGVVVLRAPIPVKLSVTARDATPVANEIVTERLNADLKVVGDVNTRLNLQGDVHILHADIRIPESLPGAVAVIPVRNLQAPGKSPTKPGPGLSLGLHLKISARQVFVRGRGLDADVAGTTHVGGTSENPAVSGGFTLQRGTFSLAGQRLKFTEGSVNFIGAGISDPALHFVATTTTNTMTATLTVGGTAQSPTITLSSLPQMPQDEILAQILFQRNVSSLSPFEVAQLAAAVASFSGVTSGLDPLAKLRQSLGLDQLSVGTNAEGSPMVRAGRYLAPGIYLGAKQSATGAGTQAEIQIDIAKGLKLDTTAGTGSTSATGAASAGQEAGVGLTYQFQY